MTKLTPIPNYDPQIPRINANSARVLICHTLNLRNLRFISSSDFRIKEGSFLSFVIG